MEETIVSEFVLVATRKISEILPAVFGILWIFAGPLGPASAETGARIIHTLLTRMKGF
jgi:hypothetical protein